MTKAPNSQDGKYEARDQAKEEGRPEPGICVALHDRIVPEEPSWVKPTNSQNYETENHPRHPVEQGFPVGSNFGGCRVAWRFRHKWLGRQSCPALRADRHSLIDQPPAIAALFHGDAAAQRS